MDMVQPHEIVPIVRMLNETSITDGSFLGYEKALMAFFGIIVFILAIAFYRNRQRENPKFVWKFNLKEKDKHESHVKMGQVGKADKV
ncbi:hypothetical protein TrVE_jg6584 [Triparma verrucosa]|uniref:Uncharacterized protein n=1 Tax=Triparma verrucosa TaxID=1606542 RepID=A0A9W7C2P4_9STRA|nr:hypothetical protein TrVE_jg6584 [Triparma verrucosa]